MSSELQSSTVSRMGQAYLWLSVIWIVVSAFNYGFGISGLNAVSDELTCNYGTTRPSGSSFMGLPSCIGMSDAQFGILTSSYTVGGFLGSLVAGYLADHRGRRAAIVYSAWAVVAGNVLMTLAVNLPLALLGRTIIGIGSGAATVIVPLFLSEIAPQAIKGSIGILNQVAITVGIASAIALGIPLARPSLWRIVTMVSGAIAAAQLLVAAAMPESPVWQANALAGKTPERDVEAEDAHDEGEHDAGAPLLAQNQHRSPLSVRELFTSPEPGLRKGLFIIVVAMLAQQFSGINAVFYFSTRILGAIMPAQAGFISLFLAFANIVIGLAPVFLVERVGRRPLLLFSLFGISIASFVLALAINSSAGVLASIFILGHVASFAIGAGPIPFVIIGEVVPSYAAGSAGSLGLAVNWSANFIVGVGFLPLQNALSGGSREGSGNIFFVFAGLSFALLLVLSRTWR